MAGHSKQARKDAREEEARTPSHNHAVDLAAAIRYCQDLLNQSSVPTEDDLNNNSNNSTAPIPTPPNSAVAAPLNSVAQVISTPVIVTSQEAFQVATEPAFVGNNKKVLQQINASKQLRPPHGAFAFSRQKDYGKLIKKLETLIGSLEELGGSDPSTRIGKLTGEVKVIYNHLQPEKDKQKTIVCLEAFEKSYLIEKYVYIHHICLFVFTSFTINLHQGPIS